MSQVPRPWSRSPSGRASRREGRLSLSGTVSRWPATTTRSPRPSSVRATTVWPRRVTCRWPRVARAASTASAISCSWWLTEKVSTSCWVRATTSAVRSSFMTSIQPVRRPLRHRVWRAPEVRRREHGGAAVKRVIARMVVLTATGLLGTTLVTPPAGAAPTWRPITNLFADLSAAGGSAFTPAIGADADGDATVLWSRYNGTQYVVQSSYRPVAGAWSAPLDLAGGRRILDPQLVVDRAGNATA